MCPKHGTDFLEYKCRYCCSVAVFFCFGTTHFCNACHDDFQRMTSIPKEELPHCPAGMLLIFLSDCDVYTFWFNDHMVAIPSGRNPIQTSLKNQGISWPL